MQNIDIKCLNLIILSDNTSSLCQYLRNDCELALVVIDALLLAAW